MVNRMLEAASRGWWGGGVGSKTLEWRVLKKACFYLGEDEEYGEEG
jgi:hypothetical protein